MKLPFSVETSSSVPITRASIKSLLRQGMTLSYGDVEHVQVRIQHLQNSIDANMKQMEQLRSLYEACLKKTADLISESEEYSASIAPVRRLPKELLGEILLYVVCDAHHNPAKDHHHTKTLSNVMRVCFYWYNVCHGNPRLWSLFELSLDLDSGSLYLPADIATYLYLSHESPLSVRLKLSADGGRATTRYMPFQDLKRFLQVSHRIQSLCLHVSFRLDTPVVQDALKLVFESPLPNLREVELHIPDRYISTLQRFVSSETSFPCLQSLHVVRGMVKPRVIRLDPCLSVVKTPLSPFPLTQITDLHLQYHVHDAVDVLLFCTNVTSVHISMPPSRKGHHTESDESSSSSDDEDETEWESESESEHSSDDDHSSDPDWSSDDESLPHYPPRNPRPPLRIPEPRIFPHLVELTIEVISARGMRFGAFADVAKVLNRITAPNLSSIAFIADADQTQTLADSRARYWDEPSFVSSLIGMLERSEVETVVQKFSVVGVPLGDEQMIKFLSYMRGLKHLEIRENLPKGDKDQPARVRNRIVTKKLLRSLKISPLDDSVTSAKVPSVPFLKTLRLAVHDGWTRELMETMLESRRDGLRSAYINFLSNPIHRVDAERISQLQKHMYVWVTGPDLVWT
ncbi:hypothetical protein VNI00_015006 [Paramarasmius palmivorus]|uniref:F-box domain-containing protein n=1 Tax=Paramarasmius palmivorus TaxID=297713 RepID=A0AAW0BNX0_9AGAR